LGEFPSSFFLVGRRGHSRFYLRLEERSILLTKWGLHCLNAYRSEPYRHPVKGKLVGTSKREIVIENPEGLRLHFPREGQILRKAS
jgi:hypothetical protein